MKIGQRFCFTVVIVQDYYYMLWKFKICKFGQHFCCVVVFYRIILSSRVLGNGNLGSASAVGWCFSKIVLCS